MKLIFICKTRDRVICSTYIQLKPQLSTAQSTWISRQIPGNCLLLKTGQGGLEDSVEFPPKWWLEVTKFQMIIVFVLHDMFYRKRWNWCLSSAKMRKCFLRFHFSILMANIPWAWYHWIMGPATDIEWVVLTHWGRQYCRPSLLQIIACRLFGAKPLSEPMLPYSQLDTKEHISVKCYSRLKNIILGNAFENVVCKMVAILSRPQMVKEPRLSPINRKISHKAQIHSVAFRNFNLHYNAYLDNCFRTISIRYQLVIFYWLCGLISVFVTYCNG